MLSDRSAANLAQSIEAEQRGYGADGEEEEEEEDPQQHVYEAMDLEDLEAAAERDGGEDDERMNSSRSLSVCSELNARIIQRGGRNRASGRSNNKDKVRYSDWEEYGAIRKYGNKQGTVVIGRNTVAIRKYGNNYSGK